MNSRIGWIVALAIVLCWPSAASAVNAVILFTARGQDSQIPNQQFVMELEILLEDIDPADVTGIGVEVDNGLTSLTLERFFQGSNEWEAEVAYPDFAALKAALHGTWTITLSGNAASVSTFTITTTTLEESDYFLAPTVLTPASGATDVALDTLLEWTDPTGGLTPDVVEVEVGAEFAFEEQQDIYPFETLAFDAESWDPPLTLFPGQSFFFVGYLDVDSSPYRVGPLTGGTITWGNVEELASIDPSYPAMTPLLLLGSFTEVQFDTVRLLEDFEAYTQPQEDAVGPGFLITTSGDLADPAVLSVEEGLADRAGIELDVANKVAFAGTAAGMTGGGGFLLIADIPATGGASEAGPFADFFTNPGGSGREFFDVRLRAMARETTGATATQMRFLVFDGADNEAVSNKVALSTDFQAFEAHSFDFADLEQGSPTDFSQIIGVAIEFFAQSPGVVPQLRFQIDDVELTAAPEPGGSALGLSALAALALIARARRKRGAVTI